LGTLSFFVVDRRHVDLSKRLWTEGSVLHGMFQLEKVLGFKLLTNRGKCCT
jgi:hypothetical protein